MKNFAEYSRYFDALYRDKDYKKEADYVDRLIRKYSPIRRKTLLNIGCGTGSHDLYFLKKAYKIVGIDKSREMISIARNRALPDSKPGFYTADARTFNLRGRFDVAVSLFHVMSYLTTNAMLTQSFKNIHRHLKKGGLFIFDFWYGPAVLKQGPARKTKIVTEGGILIKRTAVPKIELKSNTVNVSFRICVSGGRDNLEKKITESHIMRYFFLPELHRMLNAAGFNVVKSLKWMSLTRRPDENAWTGLIVAKKCGVTA